MQTVVLSSRDARQLLFKATTQQDSDEPLDTHHVDYTSDFQEFQTNETASMPRMGLSAPPQEVLDVWKRSYFVQRGWMTAREGVAYIDLCASEVQSSKCVADLQV